MKSGSKLCLGINVLLVFVSPDRVGEEGSRQSLPAVTRYLLLCVQPLLSLSNWNIILFTNVRKMFLTHDKTLPLPDFP